jgi:16S rRNA (guanine527-N7)-methyltransferase
LSVVDLGSGGGVPALPLAHAWPDSRWLLIEANGRKARFLTQALHRLGLADRARVAAERAEALGQRPVERAAHDLVVARGFGPPALTAECAAPFLAIGGRLLTSEPPDARPWPEAPLAELGLLPRGRRGSVMVLQQDAPCPARFPRRNPTKRLLF